MVFTHESPVRFRVGLPIYGAFVYWLGYRSFKARKGGRNPYALPIYGVVVYVWKGHRTLTTKSPVRLPGDAVTLKSR